ncbi:MAG: response regulator [Phormidesmis sp.]
MALPRASNAAQWSDQRCAFTNSLPCLSEVAIQSFRIASELPSEAQPAESLSDTNILERSWQAESAPGNFGEQKGQVRQGGQQKSESSRQRNVLIIDDDDDNLLFAHYAVEYLGYRATSIKSGQGAVAIAMTRFPDIILLDILLKNVSGIDVLHQLRKHESIAHIPVVAVTALARPSDHKNIMAAGFSDYLLKPYMIDELERIISRHLPA